METKNKCRAWKPPSFGERCDNSAEKECQNKWCLKDCPFRAYPEGYLLKCKNPKHNE